MPITALPVDPGGQARALSHHLLEAGDIIGRDAAGRTVTQLAANDWLLDQLMTFNASAEGPEDGGDAEDDGPAVLSFDRGPARRVYGGSAVARQPVSLADRCAGRDSSRLGGLVAAKAEPWAVTGQPDTHHFGREVPAIEKADGDAAIVRALTIELRPHLPPIDHLAHSPGRLGDARLSPSGAAKPFSQIPQPSTSVVSPSRTWLTVPDRVPLALEAAPSAAEISAALKGRRGRAARPDSDRPR
ncbi:MAG TPA: hypothetical protein VLE23_16265 [Geminicoccaceae bacterium]|nr:hypothetical protein [Geminicoccaceae bacterium]